MEGRNGCRFGEFGRIEFDQLQVSEPDGLPHGLRLVLRPAAENFDLVRAVDIEVLFDPTQMTSRKTFCRVMVLE